MDKNTAISSTKIDSVVQFINESEASALFGTAFASVLVNPTVTWAKFTLTDDRVNANMQRIPDSEFDNLVRTGVNMPIKMAVGEISPGHDETKPLGVITNLRTILTEAGNKVIIALAALWAEERPADVAYLKERFNEGKSIDVSWEILYEDAVYNPAHSSMDLISTVLKAATIVGNPAYQGRTQFLSVAAKRWSKAYVEELPNEHFLIVDTDGTRHLPVMDSEGQLDRVKLKEALAGLGAMEIPVGLLREKKSIVTSLLEKFDAGASIDDVSKQFYSKPVTNLEEQNVDEITQLKAELASVQTKLDEAIQASSVKETALAERQTAFSELEAKVASLTEQLNGQETELTELRAFKAELNAEVEKQAKLDGLKTKFTEAGITKSDEYFETNATVLLGLSDESLALIISEAKSSATASIDTTTSLNTSNIPALQGEGTSEPSVKDMAVFLRERKAKK